MTLKDRVSYLDDEGVSLVRESLGQTTVKPTAALTAPAPDVAARLDGIERSIMALVEAHGREAASIREQMARLVEENRSLRLRLEPPPPEPARQVKAWSPEPAPDPADGMPWWRVAWLSLVAPERLRRCDS